jgi:hypothetical protein
LKKHWRFKVDQAKQRFRLTSAERQVAAFVLAAVMLGLVTKCYRDRHPSPAPLTTTKQHQSSSRHARRLPSLTQPSEAIAPQNRISLLAEGSK